MLTGERAGYYADFGALADLAKALTGAFVYDSRLRAFVIADTADRPPASPAITSSFLQNHDQVGNRAQGSAAAISSAPGA